MNRWSIVESYQRELEKGQSMVPQMAAAMETWMAAWIGLEMVAERASRTDTSTENWKDDPTVVVTALKKDFRKERLRGDL